MPGIYLTNAADFIKVTGRCESEVRQPSFEGVEGESPGFESGRC